MIFKKQAFTLVELIVTITILSILSTIGFVSYSGYLSGTRDASRISSLKSISEGLRLYSTRNKLPLPDESATKVMNGTIQIATQGYAGKNVLDTIEYSTEGKDPKDGIYYSYYLTKNKKYFQLMAFLEEEENLQITTQAIDYSIRYPTVVGDKLGMLTDINNIPIQETGTSSLDITDVGNLELKSYLNDGEILVGTGTIFSNLGDIANVGGKLCSIIRKYPIDPGNNFQDDHFYCNSFCNRPVDSVVLTHLNSILGTDSLNIEEICNIEEVKSETMNGSLGYMNYLTNLKILDLSNLGLELGVDWFRFAGDIYRYNSGLYNVQKIDFSGNPGMKSFNKVFDVNSPREYESALGCEYEIYGDGERVIFHVINESCQG